MNEWYYSDAGQQRGPVSFDELRQRAASGLLDPVNDLVWNSTMSNWQPVGQVPGIFDSVSTAVLNTANPYAPPVTRDPSAPQSKGTLAMIPPGSQQLDAIACLSRTFTMTNRNFLHLLGVGVVFLLVSGIVGMATFWMGGGFKMLETFRTYSSNPYSNPASYGVYYQFPPQYYPLQILNVLFSVFLHLGLVRIGLNAVSGEKIAISQLFSQGRKVLRAIAAVILVGLITFAGFMLLILPGVYFFFRFSLFMQAIVDRNLGVIDSLKYSWNLTRNSVLPLILLWVLNFLLMAAAALLLGIGLIYVIPLVTLTHFMAYRWLQFGAVAAQDEPGTETPVLRGRVP